MLTQPEESYSIELQNFAESERMQKHIHLLVSCAICPVFIALMEL